MTQAQGTARLKAALLALLETDTALAEAARHHVPEASNRDIADIIESVDTGTLGGGGTADSITGVASDPGSPAAGDVYYNTTSDTFFGYNGVSWLNLGAGAAGGLDNIVEDLTPQLGGDLDANGNSVLFDNGDGISDSSGNEQLRFIEAASAINQIRITNAAAGNSPTITGEGDDTNVDLALAAQGSGIVKVGGSQVATIAGTQTLTNKTLTSPVVNTGVSGTAVLDEDDMTSNSATQLATQQSIKAYADTKLADVVDDTTPQLGGDLDAQANTIAGHEAAINAQTGTTYTLLAADSGKVVTLNNASAITATVGSTIPAGWHCTIVQKGAGQVTVAAGGTGNVRNRSSHTKLAGQYAMGTLFVEANGGTAPEVYLGGDTGA